MLTKWLFFYKSETPSELRMTSSKNVRRVGRERGIYTDLKALVSPAPLAYSLLPFLEKLRLSAFAKKKRCLGDTEAPSLYMSRSRLVGSSVILASLSLGQSQVAHAGWSGAMNGLGAGRATANVTSVTLASST